MIRHVGKSRALVLGALLLGACAAACSPKNPGGITAQSPERQSETEYDLARDLFQNRNQPRMALDHALKAVELNDENDKALYLTSAIYLSFCANDRGLDDPDCKIVNAEKYARLAVKQNDNFRDAKNLLANILILEKRYKEAIQILEPLTRDPSFEQIFLAWGNLGQAQILDGQLDSGISSERNAIAAQPKFCVGHYWLAYALEKKNDAVSSEKSFSDALAVDAPECQALQDAWAGRGRVRMRLNRAPDAKRDFEKCKDLSDKTPTGKECAKSLSGLGASGSAAGAQAQANGDGGKP
jgi:tetratricopeptide (TPR) repeat protein